ncbi:hypothetical protein D3C74_335910 [compost metagenome]
MNIFAFSSLHLTGLQHLFQLPLPSLGLRKKLLLPLDFLTYCLPFLCSHLL